MTERLAKRIARAGMCSRRDAEKWIEAGRVRVDGELITTPAFNVTEASQILIDGQPLSAPPRQRIWLYYKPVGLVTTHKDPQGRLTVFEALKDKLPRVVSVGRLDLNSEGLLILTNDGAYAREAELPSNQWPRTYRVRVFGFVNEEALDRLKQGIVVEGVRYGAIQAELTRVTGRNAWLLMTIHEGKNREIRKVLNHLDLQVNRLIRVSYGPFELGDMEPGDIKEITLSEAQPKLKKSWESSKQNTRKPKVPGKPSSTLKLGAKTQRRRTNDKS